MWIETVGDLLDELRTYNPKLPVRVEDTAGAMGSNFKRATLDFRQVNQAVTVTIQPEGAAHEGS